MKRKLNLLRIARQFRSSINGEGWPEIPGTDQKHYNTEFFDLMYMIDPRVPCPFGCEWLPPFGWLPNASCPRHD
jgi:hypothetical protein